MHWQAQWLSTTAEGAARSKEIDILKPPDVSTYVFEMSNEVVSFKCTFKYEMPFHNLAEMDHFKKKNNQQNVVKITKILKRG